MRPTSCLLVVASLVIIACGSPKAGDACNTTGFVCADATTALECRVSKWAPLPCRGPNGCSRASTVVKCDMSLNVVGDACASVAEGKGLCTPDGLATIECRDGTLVKTNTCRSCSIVGDNVVCQP